MRIVSEMLHRNGSRCIRKGRSNNFFVLNPDKILCKPLFHIYIYLLCAPVKLSCYTGTLLLFFVWNIHHWIMFYLFFIQGYQISVSYKRCPTNKLQTRSLFNNKGKDKGGKCKCINFTAVSFTLLLEFRFS